MDRAHILQRFSKLSENKKVDTLYVEIIKIKKTLNNLKAFDEGGLSKALGENHTKQISLANRKYGIYSNKLTKLTNKHTKIKNDLTWQSSANYLLKQKLISKGEKLAELNKFLEKEHQKFIKEKGWEIKEITND